MACGSYGGAPQEAPLPDAVKALIHDLETQPVRNPPALVARFDYAGQQVYYVPPYCCDFFGDLYDAAGHVICHPDGGFDRQGRRALP